MSDYVVPENIKKAQEFFAKNATVSDKGVLRLSSRSHMEFLNSNGITEETVRAIDSLNCDLLNGAISHVADLNVDKVKQAIKDGTDPKEVSTKFTIKGPTAGSTDISTTMYAHREFSTPASPGEKSSSYQHMSFTVHAKRAVDTDMHASTAAAMDKILSGKK